MRWGSESTQSGDLWGPVGLGSVLPCSHAWDEFERGSYRCRRPHTDRPYPDQIELPPHPRMELMRHPNSPRPNRPI